METCKITMALILITAVSTSLEATLHIRVARPTHQNMYHQKQLVSQNYWGSRKGTIKNASKRGE